MAWLRIDDRVRTHPKIAMAGPTAAWLWLCGVCYCREHLTDGFIPRIVVPTLAAVPAPYKQAAMLVSVRLWEVADGGYQVHDFLDWNPSRADIEAGREWETKRKGLYRDKDLGRLVRERDQDCCRYCGRRVNWMDRRGPGGGQHDHVVPRGPSELSNVVVSCRECNRKKWDRTPEEAGMVLLPVPIQSGPSSGSSSKPSSPSRVRAGDAGLGSLSGDLGSEVLSEESARETTDEIAPGWRSAATKTTALVDGAYLRRHGQHAFCGRVCVPTGLHSDLTARLGTTDAPERLKAWYGDVLARYDGRPIGDDLFAFWNHEFAAWVGTVTSKPSASGGDKASRTLSAAERVIARQLDTQRKALPDGTR